MSVHVAPLGSMVEISVCGRLRTDDQHPCNTPITLARWMCKQPAAGKPAQDASGLNVVLDRILKQKRARD